MIAQKDNRRLRTQDHDDAADLIHEFKRVYADALVAACGMEFEPNLDEWIAIDSIIEVATISNTSADR